MRCRQRDDGTSHIAPPDMNSYIEKYEFIYLETYEFIHLYEFISPCDLSFHAYVSDGKKKMATDKEAGRRMADGEDCERNFDPWFKSPPGYNFFC